MTKKDKKKNKGQNIHASCKNYKVHCIVKNNYIEQKKHNVITCWGEHNNPTRDSEPAQYLRNNLHHSFNRLLFVNASSNKRQQKDLEAIYITLKKQKNK